MGLFDDILKPQTPTSAGLFDPSTLGGGLFTPEQLPGDENKGVDQKGEAGQPSQGSAPPLGVLQSVPVQGPPPDLQRTSQTVPSQETGLFQAASAWSAATNPVTQASLPPNVATRTAVRAVGGLVSGLFGGIEDPIGRSLSGTEATEKGYAPLPSALQDPAAALSNPEWWGENAGFQVGFALGPGKVAAALSPPLAGLRSIPGRILPWAGLGAVQGAVEGIQQPDATAGSVAESAAIGGVTQGLFGGVLDVGHLGLRRLFRPPSGLPKLGESPTGGNTAEAHQASVSVDVARSRASVARGEGIPADIFTRYTPNPNVSAGLFGGLPLPSKAVITEAATLAKVGAEQLALLLSSVEGGADMAKAIAAAGI